MEHYRIIMEFGAGQIRKETEIFNGTKQECQEEFDNLPTAEELGEDAYELTLPFKERSWIEEIQDGDDPRWP